MREAHCLKHLLQSQDRRQELQDDVCITLCVCCINNGTFLFCIFARIRAGMLIKEIQFLNICEILVCFVMLVEVISYSVLIFWIVQLYFLQLVHDKRSMRT